MIQPDWDSKYKQDPDKLVHLAPSDLEMNQPVMYGTVVRTGEDCHYVKAGDYVVMEPGKGAEAGIDTLFYFIKEIYLLGTINGINSEHTNQ